MAYMVYIMGAVEDGVRWFESHFSKTESESRFYLNLV